MARLALTIARWGAMLSLLSIVVLLTATFVGVGSTTAVIGQFVAFLFEHPFFIPACLIILPSLLPTRSVFVAYSAVLGLLFGGVWTYAEYQERQAGYAGDGAGGAFGLALFLVLAMSFASGAVARVILHRLIHWKRKINAAQAEFTD